MEMTKAEERLSTAVIRRRHDFVASATESSSDDNELRLYSCSFEVVVE